MYEILISSGDDFRGYADTRPDGCGTINARRDATAFPDRETAERTADDYRANGFTATVRVRTYPDPPPAE